MATPIRRCMTAALVVGCLALTEGCRHRAAVPTLPPVLQAPIAPPPEPNAPAMEGAPPDSITHAPPAKVTEAKPARKSKRSAQKSPPAPTETAAVAPPPAPASVVGELTTGGDVSPKAQQEMTELIAADERRFQALTGTKAHDQVTQLKEVRRFLDQAKEVLATGDEEGARTLATKAKLLIDDLEKWAEK